MLTETLRGAENVYAAWVAVPNHTGCFLDPDELAARLSRERVSAVRLFPNGFSTADWCGGSLFSALDELRMPVFLDYGIDHYRDRLPWDDVYRLCQTYARTPFILTRVGCASNMSLFPLLDRCENLRFEISYYQASRGIETVASRFGAHRMLYGTGAPVYSPSCATGLLYYSALGQGDKRRIACENMEDLIRGIRYAAP